MENNSPPRSSLIRAAQQNASPNESVVIGCQVDAAQLPSIKTSKKDGSVELIEVRCSCGETLVIECVYK